VARGLAVTGTLGIPDLAARRQLIDFEEAIERLQRTSFRYRKGVIEGLLGQHRQR